MLGTAGLGYITYAHISSLYLYYTLPGGFIPSTRQELANVLSVSVDEFLCDSVIHSKEVFSHEVQMLLEDCDDYEVRILTDLLKAAKDTIRRDMKLKQQE